MYITVKEIVTSSKSLRHSFCSCHKVIQWPFPPLINYSSSVMFVTFRPIGDKKRKCSDLMWCKQGEGWEPENNGDPHSDIKTNTHTPQLNESEQVNKSKKAYLKPPVCVLLKKKKQWGAENEVLTSSSDFLLAFIKN